MNHLISTIIIFITFTSSVINSGESDKNEEWWNHVIPENYTKLFPSNFIEHFILKRKDSDPTVVEVYLWPKLIASISMKNMDFEMDISLETTWIDNRLLNPEKYVHSSLKTALMLPEETAQNIWIPSLSFVNCKGCTNTILNPKEQKFYISWHPNKTKIYVYIRKMFKLTCDFILTLYPFDTQECSIILQISDFSVDLKSFHRRLIHLTENEITKITSPPEYKMQKISSYNCSAIDVRTEGIKNNCRKFTISLQRQLLPHVMLTFIPSMLIVILSWISFWLNPEAAGPRVALGLTSLLTLATLFSNGQRELPASNKLKALDVWMFACIFTVFASLLEFCISSYWQRHFEESDTKITSADVEELKLKDQSPFIHRMQMASNSKRKSVNAAKLRILNKLGEGCAILRTIHPKRIDQISRALFPICFGTFNIIFWTHYL